MTGEDFEEKIGKYHHRLELVRTCVPVCVLVIQLVIAARIFHLF